MTTLDERAHQGELARQVLDNEAFTRAFDAIEQEHIEAWKNAPARDVEGRESLWKTVKVLYRVKAMLEASMTDGKLARVEQEHQERILAEQRREGINVDGMY